MLGDGLPRTRNPPIASRHWTLAASCWKSSSPTDGAQIYVADYGLALCADFGLAPAEREFFEAHRLYDRSYVDWAFGEWLRRAEPPLVMTPALEARLESVAPVADVFARFINSLNNVSNTTPFPAAEMEAALAAAGG